MSGDNESGGEERKPFILEKPLYRGLFNAVALVLLMIGAQHQGWLGKGPPITGEDVYRAVVYGAVFGCVMYLYQSWRLKRRAKAEPETGKTDES